LDESKKDVDARDKRGHDGVQLPLWPGLTRPSTSFLDEAKKDVDARDKRGHDG
jgi:hypothetical protein